MKDTTQAAGISSKANHCVHRKSLVQKLQVSGVPPNQIIQIMGHKKLQSVNNYNSLPRYVVLLVTPPAHIVV